MTGSRVPRVVRVFLGRSSWKWPTGASRDNPITRLSVTAICSDGSSYTFTWGADEQPDYRYGEVREVLPWWK